MKKSDNLRAREQRASSLDVAHVDTAACPEYSILADRDKELLRIYSIGVPDTRRLVINTSQSDVTMCEGLAPTLTPHGTFWLAWLGRYLRGHEALQLQGMYVPHSMKNKYDSPFLQDLAGNAFATPCILSGTILHLCVLSRCWSNMNHTACHTAVVCF